jgi:putative MATE family efflux protein
VVDSIGLPGASREADFFLLDHDDDETRAIDMQSIETQREPGNALRGWAGLLRDAMRGQGVDPARDPVGRAIVFLAVPMVLEMVMESIFAVVDIFFVAKLGAAAVAGVGLTESMLTMVYTVAGGLSIGVTAMVSRRMGERNPEGAADAVVQAVLLGLGVAVVFGVLGAVYAPTLLRLMGGSPEVLEASSGYTRILLGGSGIILMLFLLNAAFRGAGDAAVAMRVLWLANGINLVLDPCLIFGLGPFPELGVAGAAIATTIGRGTAVAVQLVTILKLDGRLRVHARQIGVRASVMLRLLRLSGTGTLQIFIATASWVGLMRILAGFGSEALAGYTIAIRIVLFALLPAWGLANAAATMVGQGLGAGDPDRAERSVLMAGRLNLYFLGSIGIVFIAFAPFIVGLFGSDPATANHASRCLRIVSAGFFFYAWGMVLTQSFNGAGAAWTPTILNLFCFWLWEIPLAWGLSHAGGYGPDGVFISVTVAFSTIAVVSAILFRRGRWKMSVV